MTDKLRLLLGWSSTGLAGFGAHGLVGSEWTEVVMNSLIVCWIMVPVIVLGLTAYTQKRALHFARK